jgi:hypothetical protein
VGPENIRSDDLMTEIRGKMSSLSERRAFRVLKRLVDDGRIIREGGRAFAFYRRAG